MGVFSEKLATLHGERYAAVYRYRRVSSASERQQTKYLSKITEGPHLHLARGSAQAQVSRF